MWILSQCVIVIRVFYCFFKNRIVSFLLSYKLHGSRNLCLMTSIISIGPRTIISGLGWVTNNHLWVPIHLASQEPTRQIWLSPSLYKWESWGIERLSNLLVMAEFVMDAFIMMTFCHKQMLVRRTEGGSMGAVAEQLWLCNVPITQTGQAFSELESLLQCAPEVGEGWWRGRRTAEDMVSGVGKSSQKYLRSQADQFCCFLIFLFFWIESQDLDL